MVPSTLGLAVNPLVLAGFVPGVSQTYTGTTTATVTSSWPTAPLSVYDADPNNATNGRLINGRRSIIPRDMDVLNSAAAYQAIGNATSAADHRDLGDPGRQRVDDDHDAPDHPEQRRARLGRGTPRR